MIAIAKFAGPTKHSEDYHQQFLEMLPKILRQAEVAFRGRKPEALEELTQEVVASAYCAFVQLACRGKTELAYPTPLAQYAIRQIYAGRRVGTRQNASDVLSPCARLKSRIVERIDRHDKATGTWRQLLVEDHRAGPAETAAARLDLVAWLRQLSPRNRRIARALAIGERTSRVAQEFSLTAGRVSQLRNLLFANWQQFQGLGPAGATWRLRAKRGTTSA